MAPDPSLKLRAEDPDDLAVISAIVQDALVSVKDLVFDRDAQSFTVVANRFRWEARTPDAADRGADGAPPFERTHCALSIGTVEKVSYRGFRRSQGERILSLLAICPGDNGTIDLEFSGGARVRLAVAAIGVRLADVGEPWPTAWQPDHADTPP